MAEESAMADSGSASGRVARLKAGLNLNLGVAPGGKPPPVGGFRLPAPAPSPTPMDTTDSSKKTPVEKQPHLHPVPRTEVASTTTTTTTTTITTTTDKPAPPVAKKPTPPAVTPKPGRPVEHKDAPDATKADKVDSAGPVSVAKLRGALQINPAMMKPGVAAARPKIDADTIDAPQQSETTAVRKQSESEGSASAGVKVKLQINPLALLPGAKPASDNVESEEQSDQHTPLESLTKGRPKMVKRRAPRLAAVNEPTDDVPPAAESPQATTDAAETPQPAVVVAVAVAAVGGGDQPNGKDEADHDETQPVVKSRPPEQEETFTLSSRAAIVPVLQVKHEHEQITVSAESDKGPEITMPRVKNAETASVSEQAPSPSPTPAPTQTQSESCEFVAISFTRHAIVPPASTADCSISATASDERHSNHDHDHDHNKNDTHRHDQDHHEIHQSSEKQKLEQIAVADVPPQPDDHQAPVE